MENVASWIIESKELWARCMDFQPKLQCLRILGKKITQDFWISLLNCGPNCQNFLDFKFLLALSRDIVSSQYSRFYFNFFCDIHLFPPYKKISKSIHNKSANWNRNCVRTLLSIKVKSYQVVILRSILIHHRLNEKQLPFHRIFPPLWFKSRRSGGSTSLTSSDKWKILLF